MRIEYQPIGIIHTPFENPVGMPIQPAGAAGISGSVQLFPEYAAGLQDLAGFSHIILLYHFHRSAGFDLMTTPFMGKQEHGLFATRTPRRPNPIGLSTVKLISVEEHILHIEEVDMLNGTPLLDVKPYVPEFDRLKDCCTGWLEEERGKVHNHKSDDRFR
jgi:tRNA-Thr(GGU) m(6)t(6)A37 methyltransferase TsaA